MNKIKSYLKTYYRILVILLVITPLAQITRMQFLEIRLYVPLRIISILGIMLVFIVWNISTSERIIQKSIKQHISTFTFLILLWYFFRTVKYHFLFDEILLNRYLWYLYYLPMILLPMIAVFTVVCIGKDENYRLPSSLKLLYIPASILIIGILTNDFHHIAFKIGANHSVESRGVIYYAVLIWSIVLLGVFVVTIYKKCEIPYSKHHIWAPLVLIALGAVYLIAYAFHMEILNLDLSTAICAIAICVWESCIASGLIISNTNYSALFSKTKVATQIIDNKENAVYQSESIVPISKAQVSSAILRETMLDKNNRLRSSKIGGGYVLWVENIAALNMLIDKLRDISADLKESNALLIKENEVKKRQIRASEQNYLYDSIASSISPQLQILSIILNNVSDDNVKQKLGEVCIISAYVKRKSNLMLLAETNETLDAEELRLSLEECIKYVELYGIKTRLRFLCKGNIPVKRMVDMLDKWEAYIEKHIHSVSELAATVNNSGIELFGKEGVINAPF